MRAFAAAAIVSGFSTSSVNASMPDHFLGQLGEQILADVGGIDLGPFLAMATAVERPMPCAADVTRCGLALSLSAMDFYPRLQSRSCRRLPSASNRDLSMTMMNLCYLTARTR